MNPGRPLVDTNGNDVEANKYYIIKAIGSDLEWDTFLIKRVAPASNDSNAPAWLRNNKNAFFDYEGQEVGLDNTTSTFTPVEPVASYFSMPSVPSMSLSMPSLSMPSLPFSMPSVPSMPTLSLPNFSTSVKPSGGKRKRTKRPKRKRSRKTKLIRK